MTQNFSGYIPGPGEVDSNGLVKSCIILEDSTAGRADPGAVDESADVGSKLKDSFECALDWQSGGDINGRIAMNISREVGSGSYEG